MNVNPPQPISNKWLLRNEPDGLWEYGMLNDADTLLLQNLTMKFPANIGDSWPIIAYKTTDTSITIGDTLMMVCIDTDREYITPVGIFQCYVYQYEWVSLQSSEVNFVHSYNLTESIYNRQQSEADTLRFAGYFAENIGLVGQEYSLGSFTTKSYLISYELVSNVQTFKNDLKEFQLYQNYPNPFNPSTIISYSIPSASNVTIKVFDVLGNEIGTLVNEFKPAGNYDLEFNASGLPSGLYFYRIISGNYSNTKKMLLMK